MHWSAEVQNAYRNWKSKGSSVGAKDQVKERRSENSLKPTEFGNDIAIFQVKKYSYSWGYKYVYNHVVLK